ncbi:unnamed protein product, partial [Rotaria magnacalcarata]
MASTSTPTSNTENDDSNISIYGQDNPAFLTEDDNVDIKQFNSFTNHLNNLRVSFRKDSIAVDIDPPYDSLEPFDD